jgi:hypothetical protein
MKRFTLIIALAAVAALAMESAAAAKPGWKLPTVRSKDNGIVYKSRATTCGSEMFGSYRFRNSAKRGKRWSGFVLYRATILQNPPGQSTGGASVPKFLKFGGDLPKKVKKQTRNLLDSVLFRFSVGPPQTVDSVFPDGSLQASRPFNPVPTDRC